MPPKVKAEPDQDVARAANAIRVLREGLGLSQPAAADAADPPMTAQYWSMHEVGKVPGIVKPATQRKLLEALSAAARLETPLSLDDFNRTMANSDAADPRALRLAAAIAPPARPERQAVFPTSAGDVVFTYPEGMDAQGFRELEAYFEVFVKAHKPRDA